jgi:hypothetical protein
MRPKADLDAIGKRNNSCPYRESNSGRLARSLLTALSTTFKYFETTVFGSKGDEVQARLLE